MVNNLNKYKSLVVMLSILKYIIIKYFSTLSTYGFTLLKSRNYLNNYILVLLRTIKG